jgi:hypothetical protein
MPRFEFPTVVMPAAQFSLRSENSLFNADAIMRNALQTQHASSIIRLHWSPSYSTDTTMATFVGDSSSERYTSIAMSKSPSSSSATASTSLADASQLKGLDGVEIYSFTGITNMQKITF